MKFVLMLIQNPGEKTTRLYFPASFAAGADMGLSPSKQKWCGPFAGRAAENPPCAYLGALFSLADWAVSPHCELGSYA